jgi:hypothetical protein
MARLKKVQYRRIYGQRVMTTTADKWERLKASELGRSFVLVQDLSQLEVISDPAPKPKRRKVKDEGENEGVEGLNEGLNEGVNEQLETIDGLPD